MLFYRITHLTRGKQYHIWSAAVTTAGRGNISSKVTVEPAGKGGSSGGGCSGEEGQRDFCKDYEDERYKDGYEIAASSPAHESLSSLSLRVLSLMD